MVKLSHLQKNITAMLSVQMLIPLYASMIWHTYGVCTIEQHTNNRQNSRVRSYGSLRCATFLPSTFGSLPLSAGIKPACLRIVLFDAGACIINFVRDNFQRIFHAIKIYESSRVLFTLEH